MHRGEKNPLSAHGIKAIVGSTERAVLIADSQSGDIIFTSPRGLYVSFLSSLLLGSGASR
jgi:hypothetical protein